MVLQADAAGVLQRGNELVEDLSRVIGEACAGFAVVDDAV
jgi:hypothetical protein